MQAGIVGRPLPVYRHHPARPDGADQRRHRVHAVGIGQHDRRAAIVDDARQAGMVMFVAAFGREGRHGDQPGRQAADEADGEVRPGGQRQHDAVARQRHRPQLCRAAADLVPQGLEAQALGASRTGEPDLRLVAGRSWASCRKARRHPGCPQTPRWSQLAFSGSGDPGRSPCFDTTRECRTQTGRSRGQPASGRLSAADIPGIAIASQSHSHACSQGLAGGALEVVRKCAGVSRLAAVSRTGAQRTFGSVSTGSFEPAVRRPHRVRLQSASYSPMVRVV